MSRVSTRILALLGVSMLLFISFAPAQAQGGAATPLPPTQAPLTLTISGTVTSGTAGMSISPGLALTLHLLRPDPRSPGVQTDIQRMATEIDSSLRYRFENVKAQTGDYLFLSASVEGVQQSSVIVELTPGQPSAFDLPLTLYGLTDDPSVITLFRVQHILDFKNGGLMQVLASHYYRNTSDRFYVTRSKTADGRRVSVTVPLPIGAVGIAFDDASQFAIGGSDIAPIVQDTRPIRPGQVQELIFSYQVPYSKSASIDQDYPYNTEGVAILIPDDANVNLSGAPVPAVDNMPRLFTTSRNTTINPSRSYTQYQLTSALKAGERLVYTLEGGAPAVAASGRNVDQGPSFVAIVVLMITLLAGVALVIMVVRGRLMRRVR
jgi:hypothetical protein